MRERWSGLGEFKKKYLEIIQGLRDRKLKISQAEKAIIKAKAKKADVKSNVIPRQDNVVRLTDENLAALKEMGGILHSLVNRAVEEFIARHREKEANAASERPEEEASESVNTDKESPRPRILTKVGTFWAVH